MKKYSLIAFALFFTLTLSANELSWVDTQVEAIKPPRKGMSNSSVATIRSPFIFLDKNKSKDKKDKTKKGTTKVKKKPLVSSKDSNTSSKKKKSYKGFVLSAIINNSALINGVWYKLNDKVYTYRLSSVDRTSVVLTEGKRKLLLSTSETKRNLKFKNK